MVRLMGVRAAVSAGRAVRPFDRCRIDRFNRRLTFRRGNGSHMNRAGLFLIHDSKTR